MGWYLVKHRDKIMAEKLHVGGYTHRHSAANLCLPVMLLHRKEGRKEGRKVTLRENNVTNTAAETYENQSRLYDDANNNNAKCVEWPEDVSCNQRTDNFLQLLHSHFFIPAVMNAVSHVFGRPDCIIPVTFL
jgi:hypothetical protein